MTELDIVKRAEFRARINGEDYAVVCHSKTGDLSAVLLKRALKSNTLRILEICRA